MRRGTLLTSFVLDEITAQARYRNLLDAAAQRRLRSIARATRPRWPERRWPLREYLVACGEWLKEYTVSLVRSE